MHALALDVGAGLLPHRQRFGVVAELDADLLEDPVGIGLDQRDAFLVENLVDLYAAADIGELLPRPAAGTCGAARAGPAPVATAPPSARKLGFIDLVHRAVLDITLRA